MAPFDRSLREFLHIHIVACSADLDKVPLTPDAPRAARFRDVKCEPVPWAIPVKSSKVPLRGILKRNGQDRVTVKAGRKVGFAKELASVKVVDRWIGEPWVSLPVPPSRTSAFSFHLLPAILSSVLYHVITLSSVASSTVRRSIAPWHQGFWLSSLLHSWHLRSSSCQLMLTMSLQSKRMEFVHPDPSRYMGKLQGWCGPDGQECFTTGWHTTYGHAGCTSPGCNKKVMHASSPCLYRRVIG